MPEPNADPNVDPQTQEMKELIEEAKMFGFETVREYVNYLSASDTPATPSPKPQDKPADPPEPAPSGQAKPDSDDDDRARRASYTAFINSQWATHEVGELKKPEAERDTTPRSEYMKMINSPLGPVLLQLAQSEPELDGNIFAAARHYRDLKSTIKGNAQRRTDSDATRRSAQDSIGLNPDTAVPVFKTDADWKQGESTIADAIAPRRGIFEG